MKIYKSTHFTIYIGNTDLTLIKDGNNDFICLEITSINLNNSEKYYVDNGFFLLNLKENKKEIKRELKEKNLWEKGIFKAIKILMKQ